MSVAQLAKLIIAAFQKRLPGLPRDRPRGQGPWSYPRANISESGHYQDIQRRVPSIEAIRRQLGWKPKVDLKTAIRLTLDYHLAHKDYQLD